MRGHRERRAGEAWHEEVKAHTQQQPASKQAHTTTANAHTQPMYLLWCAIWCCELDVLVGVIQAGPDERCHAAVNNNELLVAVGLHT